MHFDADFPWRFDYFPVMEGQSKVSIFPTPRLISGETPIN